MKFKLQLGSNPPLAPIRLSKCVMYREHDSGLHAQNWRKYRTDPDNQPRKLHRFNVVAKRSYAYGQRCCPAFEFQAEGIEFLRSSTNGFAIIGDQMGMGKTRQLLTATRKILAQQGGIAIIFCPVSVAPSWVSAVYENVKIPLDIELTPQHELEINRARNSLKQVMKRSDAEGIGGYEDIPVPARRVRRYEATHPYMPGSTEKRFSMSDMTCDINVDMNRDQLYVANNVNVVYYSKVEQAEAELRRAMGIVSRQDEAAKLQNKTFGDFRQFAEYEASLTNMTPGTISDYEPMAQAMINLKPRKRTVIIMPYSQVGPFLQRSGGQVSADTTQVTRYSAILPRLARLLRVVIADEADEVRNLTQCSIGKSRMSRLLIHRMRQFENADAMLSIDPAYMGRLTKIEDEIEVLTTKDTELTLRAGAATGQRAKVLQDEATANALMLDAKMQQLSDIQNHTLDTPDPRFVFMATGTPVNNRLTDIQRILRVGMRWDLSRGLDRDARQIEALTKISKMDTFIRNGRLDLVMEVLEEHVFPYIISRNFNMDVGLGLDGGRSTIYIDPSIVTVYAVPNTVSINREMRKLIAKFQTKADRLQVAISDAQRKNRGLKQPFNTAGVQQAFESVNTTLAKMLTTSFMPPLTDFHKEDNNIGSLLTDVSPPDPEIHTLAQFRQYPMLFEAVDLAFRLVLRNLFRGPPYRKLVIACASVKPFAFISTYLIDALTEYRQAVSDRLGEIEADSLEGRQLHRIYQKLKDHNFSSTRTRGEAQSTRRKRKGKRKEEEAEDASTQPFVSTFIGATRSTERQEMIDMFQKPNLNPHVILLSIKAGGQGITLTQATDMIILGLPENVKYWLQVVARIRRISQNVTTHLHLFVTTNREAYRASYELGETYRRGDVSSGGMDQPWTDQALKRSPSAQLTNPVGKGLALLPSAYVKTPAGHLAIPYADGDGYSDGYEPGTWIKQSFTGFDMAEDSREGENVQARHQTAMELEETKAQDMGGAALPDGVGGGFLPYGTVGRQVRIPDMSNMEVNQADEMFATKDPDMSAEADREDSYREHNARFIMAKQHQRTRKRYEKSGVMLQKSRAGKVRGDSFTEFLLRLSESKSFLNDMVRGLVAPGFMPPDMVTLLRYRERMVAYMDDEDVARTVVLMGYFQRSPTNPLNFPDHVGEMASSIDALVHNLGDVTDEAFPEAVFNIFRDSVHRTQEAQGGSGDPVKIADDKYKPLYAFRGIQNMDVLEEKLQADPAYGVVPDNDDSVTRRIQWRELYIAYRQLSQLRNQNLEARNEQLETLLAGYPSARESQAIAAWNRAAREIGANHPKLVRKPAARIRVVNYLRKLNLGDYEKRLRLSQAELNRAKGGSNGPWVRAEKAFNQANTAVKNIRAVLAEVDDDVDVGAGVASAPRRENRRIRSERSTLQERTNLIIPAAAVVSGALGNTPAAATATDPSSDRLVVATAGDDED